LPLSTLPDAAHGSRHPAFAPSKIAAKDAGIRTRGGAAGPAPDCLVSDPDQCFEDAP